MEAMPEREHLSAGRQRLARVFQYLEALNQLRNPAKRQIREQPWVLWWHDLPSHPSIRRGMISDIPASGATTALGSNAAEFAGDDFILKVRRSSLTPAPAPPPDIVEWLREGWDDVDGRVEVYPSRNELDEAGQTRIVLFGDTPERPQLLARWLHIRDEWARNERPARQSLKVFEELYELHGRLAREGERLELVLGDGILSWRRPEGGVYHPILLQRLQLEFSPELPEFILREREYPVELYTALFASMPDVDGRILARCRQALQEGSYHPLGGEATSGFLRSVVAQLSALGTFLGEGEPAGELDHPRLGRAPVLFLRARNLGFTTALEAVREDLQRCEDLPSWLLNIVGVEATPAFDDADAAPVMPVVANQDAEVLFSKPANPEQLQIARRLEHYGSVLVQRPPGTGKTHTIGNLIGHLLAEGNSVLVTKPKPRWDLHAVGVGGWRPPRVRGLRLWPAGQSDSGA